MRLSFRKQAKGRHALGAAVTAIPSAPPVAVRVPAFEAPAAAVPVAPPPAPRLESPVVPAPPAPPAPVAPVLPVQPLDLDLALLHLGLLSAPPAFTPPVQAAPVQPPAPAVVPAPAVAPAPAVMPAPPVAPPSAPAGPRVELGFTDGTFRTLDPSSSAAQALSDLVAELTGKDEASAPSGS